MWISKKSVSLSIIKKQNIMNYQEFTLEALKCVNVKPTKEEMQFAYTALYSTLRLDVRKAIVTTINLSMFENK